MSRGRVEEIFSGLYPPKETTAIKLRYGFEDGVERSYGEMGELMGMTTNGSDETFSEKNIKKGY